MDNSKTTPSPHSNSNLGNSNLTLSDFERRMGFRKEFEETSENEGHPQSTFASISSSSMKKKIFGERDPNTHLDATPKEKSVIQEIHPLRIHSISDSSRSVPYDPVNNFTSPRPAFLRYNPNHRKEILLRMREEEGSVVDSEISQDQEKSVEEDSMSVASTPSKLSFTDQETLEDAKADDIEEEEVEERRPWCLRMVWILLLFGVFLLSHHFLFPMSSPSRPFQENILSTRNSMHRDLWKAHIGLSDMCLDIGEGLCDLVVSDDSVVDHLGDSVKNESLMPDEIDEGEATDGVEVAVEKDEIFMDEVNLDEVGVQDSDEEETIDAVEVVAQKNTTFLDEEETIDEVEVVAEKDTTFLDEGNVEELMVEEKREESVYESHEQEDQFIFDEALIETNSREEAQDEESESLLTPQFESVPRVLRDDQAAEESELLTVHETISRWKPDFEFASKDAQLLLASLSSLAVITGLLIGLFKYFVKSHQKSSPMPSPSPIFVLSDKPVDEKRMGSDKPSNVNFLYRSRFENKEPVLVSKMEELRSEGKDSYVNPLSSSYSSAEIKGLCATRPPTVELLGEFSIVDAVPGKVASSQTLNIKGYEESEFSKSERSRRVNIKSSLSSSKVHPYHAAEYTSFRSYTVQEKLGKKEDTAQKNAAKKVVATTPLRRSNRLQNRVTSPTP